MKSDLPALIAAYRAENPGTLLDARALRERVLAATWRRRRRRLRRAVWLLPLAAVLVSSSALAASAPARQSVSRVLERLGVMASVAPAPPRAAARRSGAAAGMAASRPEVRASDTTRAAPAPDVTPTALTSESTSSGSSAEVPAGTGDGRSASSADNHGRRTAAITSSPRAHAGDPADADAKLARAAAQAGKDPPRAPDSETDVAAVHGGTRSSGVGGGVNDAGTAKSAASKALAADIASYRLAHELHFARADYARSLAAWNSYLARFPQGTFAPEARLNRAVCLAHLGAVEEARMALGVLADGSDEYTRSRARRLQATLARHH